MQVPMPVLYWVGLDYTDATHRNLHGNKNGTCLHEYTIYHKLL